MTMLKPFQGTRWRRLGTSIAPALFQLSVLLTTSPSSPHKVQMSKVIKAIAVPKLPSPRSSFLIFLQRAVSSQVRFVLASSKLLFQVLSQAQSFKSDSSLPKLHIPIHHPNSPPSGAVSCHIPIVSFFLNGAVAHLRRRCWSHVSVLDKPSLSSLLRGDARELISSSPC